MHKSLILAALVALSLPAYASNSNGCQGNCPSDGGGTNTANGGNGYGGAGGNGYGGDSSATGVGVGIGVGVGQGGMGGSGGSGGNAVASGGNGTGFGGSSAVVGSGNSSNLNSNKADGGNASAHQGQVQGQQQGQSLDNRNINGQSSENTNVNGQQQAATATNAGNSQQVGGQSTSIKFEDVANAPPVFLGNLTATMSCAGGFNAGGSSQDGAGAFGFTWVSADCRTVVIGKEFAGIGMPDVACRVWKTTKGYKRAVKADPSLANVDCSPKPAAVVPQASLAPRTPRG